MYQGIASTTPTLLKTRGTLHLSTAELSGQTKLADRQSNRKALGLIAVLMVTLTIGWGSSFSQISVLAESMSRDLGLSSGMIYSGATVMFLVASVVAPWAGRLADRIGGLRCLIYGSLILALGLVVLSISRSLITYLLAWAIFGTAMHIGLVTAAYTGISQTLGKSAHRGIGTLTLATGLCSSIFWPLSEALLQFMEWRQVLQLYATVTLLVCLPIHIWLAMRFPSCGEGQTGMWSENPPHIRPGAEDQGFRIVTLINTLGAIITTGFAIAAIDIFTALGATREEAVAAGAAIGVSYVLSRGLATFWGDRLSRVLLVQIVYAVLLVSLLLLLVMGLIQHDMSGWIAVIVAGFFGLPAGLVGILRPSIPLYFFGAAGYGQVLGRQARQIDISTALTPSFLGTLLSASVILALGALVAAGSLAYATTLRIGGLVNPTMERNKKESP